MTQEDYNEWILHREQSKDNKFEPGYGECYCGHTTYCDCSNPGLTLFQENTRNGLVRKWKKS